MHKFNQTNYIFWCMSVSICVLNAGYQILKFLNQKNGLNLIFTVQRTGMWLVFQQNKGLTMGICNIKSFICKENDSSWICKNNCEFIMCYRSCSVLAHNDRKKYKRYITVQGNWFQFYEILNIAELPINLPNE